MGFTCYFVEMSISDRVSAIHPVVACNTECLFNTFHRDYSIVCALPLLLFLLDLCVRDD